MTTQYMPQAVHRVDNNNLVELREAGADPVGDAVTTAVVEPVAAASSISSSLLGWAGSVASGWFTWIMMFLVVAMIIIAFVIAIVAFTRIKDQNFGSLLSSWSWQTGLAAVSVTNQPLLFTVTNVTSTNQQDTSSFVPAPYDGYLQTLSCEFNAGLSLGSATFTVYIDAYPSGLCATYKAGDPDVFIQASACEPEPCNRFCKGQKISVKMTTDTLTSSAPPFKVTTQVFGKGTN